MKIFFYGSYLPDVGGVTIHISRLAQLLNSEDLLGTIYSTSKLSDKCTSVMSVKDVSYTRLRYGFFKSFAWFFVYGFKNRSSIIHFHVNPIWHAITIKLITTVGRNNIVCTLHDQMMLDNIEKYPFLFRFLFKKLLANKNIRWIVVSQTIKLQIEKLYSNCSHIYVIPAYLSAFSICDDNDEEIDRFIANKEKVITIYAHSTAIYEGKDLYGIDLAIMAINQLKVHFPLLGLVICIPGKTAISRMDYYKKLIEDFDIVEKVFFNLKPLNNTIGLLAKSDILLRPTLSDGDSLMVREGLSVGTFVVASDVVDRPKGTFLFESENLNNMVFMLSQVLGYVRVKNSVSTPLADNNYLLVKEVYNSF